MIVMVIARSCCPTIRCRRDGVDRPRPGLNRQASQFVSAEVASDEHDSGFRYVGTRQPV